MRITVLGGSGAWPTARQACSGYLAESDGFLLLIDPGYATLPRLLEHAAASAVDAVLVSHRHADHCADLSPLLRARAMSDDPPGALAVHTMPGAVDAVLALDPSRLQDGSFVLREFTPPDRFSIGPFEVSSWLLPHHVPNAGLRLTAGGAVLAYTGDTGPSPAIAAMARGTDLLLAEATHPHVVPADSAAYLSSAVQAGQHATRAGADRLVLTHLWPGTDPVVAREAATGTFTGPIEVARPGLVIDLPESLPPGGRQEMRA